MAWKMVFVCQVVLIQLSSLTFIFAKNVISKQEVLFSNAGNKSSGILSPWVEPEPEAEIEGGEAEKWPEPGPLWDAAYEKWGAAWEIHIYGFAACFFFVFIYASYYVVVNVADGLRKKYLSACLNAMMVICGLSRMLVLVLDPYHQGTKLDTPLILMRILWSLTDPCLTAADSLCILSLLETYKLSIAPQRLQRPSTIFPVIAIHFTFVFVSDLVVSEFVEAKAMLVFCQVFFITWCTTLGIAYILLGFKLDKLIFKSGIDNEVSQEGHWYIYLIYASGASNIMTSSVYVYSAAGVFGVYSDVTYVDAWPWWSLQTALRITELMAAVLVFTVSAKRVQREHKDDTYDPNAEVYAAAGRKRKQSMFSALRGQRNKQTDSYFDGKDRSDIPNRHTDCGGQEFSGVKYKQGTVCPNEESHEETMLNQLDRKDSMFTVLRDKAKLATESGQT